MTRKAEHNYSLTEQMGRPARSSTCEGYFQTHDENSFTKMYGAILQFSSRFVKTKEQSPREKNNPSHLDNFAKLVVDDNELWEEFVKEARESKIITNEGILLAFEEFRMKKAFKVYGKRDFLIGQKPTESKYINYIFVICCNISG